MVLMVVQCILMDIYPLTLGWKLMKYELHIIINTKVIVNIINVAGYIPYGGKLWCHENLAKLMTAKKFAKFSPFIFLHIYGV